MNDAPLPSAAPKADILGSSTRIVTQLTTLATALVALVTAMFALWNAVSADATAALARRSAKQSLATSGLQAGFNEPHSAPAVPDTVPFVVQLATYQNKDCAEAQQEIAGYHGAFSPAASIWHDQTGQYIVIGVSAQDLGAAQSLQKTAKKLSQDPSQAGNDLGNSVVRKSPPWTPASDCPAT